MPTLVDKTKTVDLLRHEFQSLASVGSSVSEDQWDVATCLPGWSVRDVFSHVIGTESMLAGEPPPVGRGASSRPYEECRGRRQ